MKARMLFLAVCCASWVTIGREKEPVDVRQACHEHIERYLDREIKPITRSRWTTTEAPEGVWLVEARYADKGVRGTLWCRVHDTGTEYKLVSISNRYEDRYAPK